MTPETSITSKSPITAAELRLSAVELEDMKAVEMATFNNELSKGKQANYERMINAMLKVVAIHMRLSGRFDNEQILDMVSKAKEHVMNVQRTYNNHWGLTFTLISSVVSFVSAFMAAAPLTGTAIFAAKTAQNLGESSKQIGAFGTGLSSVSQIFEQRAGGQRYAAQNDHEEHKKLHEDRKNSMNQYDQRHRELQRTMQDVNNEGHRAFGQTAGG